jgi:hypothetical protein
MKLNPIKQKVYKVVRVNYAGRLVSWNPEGDNLDISITYQPNEVVRPQVGRIFTFETLEQATRFADNYKFTFRVAHAQIWECEGYGNSWAKLATTVRATLNDLKGFWTIYRTREKENRNFSCVMGSGVPCGTIYCKALKLVTKIADVCL